MRQAFRHPQHLGRMPASPGASALHHLTIILRCRRRFSAMPASIAEHVCRNDVGGRVLAAFAARLQMLCGRNQRACAAVLQIVPTCEFVDVVRRFDHRIAAVEAIALLRVECASPRLAWRGHRRFLSVMVVSRFGCPVISDNPSPRVTRQGAIVRYWNAAEKFWRCDGAIPWFATGVTALSCKAPQNSS